MRNPGSLAAQQRLGRGRFGEHVQGRGHFLKARTPRVRGLLFVVTIPRARASGQRGRVLQVVPFGTEG
ncbi:MAG: hypothetical protein JWO49_1113 [Arthrobacter sp.]|nr:hypothetical protein [Arthrobacter sp.]